MGSTTNKPVIFIVGQTATGKSKLALTIAEKFNGEIINADSWSVYKGFDIGTAKPSQVVQKKVKHHLIDVADPKGGFSAAVYKEMATRVIKDIHSRGKLPIVVGGTGLYIDSLLYDYGFLPAGDKEQREVLNLMSLEDLIKLAESKNYDLSIIDIRNKRRVIRLIESAGKLPTSKPIRSNILVIGLEKDSTELRNSITKRIEGMFKKGLVREVFGLSKTYGWDIEPMKGIGYREFKDYDENNINTAEIKVEIIKNTTALAKKQKTWFKRNNSIHWHINSGDVVDSVTTFLNKK